MPRRGHKKSRAGCADCKRRHVKCDETRPVCVNCKVAALRCSYIKSTETSQTEPRSTAGTPAYSPLTPDVSSVGGERQDAPFRDAGSTSSTGSMSAINLDHLELLHHYETITYESFNTNVNFAQSLRETTILNALRFPFLMYAVLALSAMHLCQIRPDRSKHYHALASALQAEGLSNLNTTMLNISTENCVALFLFSTTTAMHSFCDTFSFRGADNFNEFLDKLTGSIKLMRGVRSVIHGGWWSYLQTTTLKDLLAIGSVLDEAEIEKDQETRPLWELLDEADLGAASLSTYTEAVTNLQRIFHAERMTLRKHGSVSMVFAWPVMLSNDYNELLIQRRPEALVILAFYGVVLHNHRSAWTVYDAGQFLVNSIYQYLGKHWERWLVWPRAAVSHLPTPSIASTPGDAVTGT